MQHKLHDTWRHVKFSLGMLVEILRFYRIVLRHNGSSRTMQNPSKLRSLIMRESHVLEKGMSLPTPHYPFGTVRAIQLIDYLHAYMAITNYDIDIVNNSMSILSRYITENRSHGTPINEVTDKLDTLISDTGYKLSSVDKAGTISISKADILNHTNDSFEGLLKSRHSHRNFTDEQVPDSLLEKALKMATLTPSACNRQAWRTHIFKGKKATDLLKWQGGCRGFGDKIKCAILVSSDLNSFFAHEIFQAYIDGGLYSMNLINSLHSLGLGTIPLSCGFSMEKLEGLGQYDIPENELPIVIIGIGILPGHTTVAASNRLDFHKTNTYHE